MIKGWIKASDRLPVESGYYFVRFNGKDTSYYWNQDFKQWHKHQYSPKITMPAGLVWLDESPADGDWISVKDGLPEVEKSEYSIDVLTISDYGVKIGFCDIGRKEWWLTTDSDEMLHNVTHWMPIPAPPKQSLTAPEGV